MFDQRTIYKIKDERGESSSITLDKLVADVLQMKVPDVHAWIQDAYDRVTTKKPDLGRIKKGDIVRALARKEAESHPEYEKLANEFRLADF